MAVCIPADSSTRPALSAGHQEALHLEPHASTTVSNAGEAAVDSASAFTKGADEGFVRRLSQIYRRLKVAKNLRKAMKDVEADMLSILGCKLFPIYQSVDNGKEIKASFKGGIGSDDDSGFVIKVPFSPISLAGYVALSQRSLLVENVYDAD